MHGDSSYTQIAGTSDLDDQPILQYARQDVDYYFELVVFKVGNTLFRVPKNGFMVPGTIFESMFSLPKPSMEEKIEGLNDLNPINLPVGEENFRGFLRVMYPFHGLQIKDTDWLAALDLSTMWMFEKIRNRAIRELDPWITNQNAKKVVLLAKKYRVVTWLKDGYSRLLQQQSLTAAELRASPSLDWETIANLLSVKLSHVNSYNTYGRQTSIDLGQEFKKEFLGMSVRDKQADAVKYDPHRSSVLRSHR